VSRVHAEVRLDGWDVLLVDSGSHNGTYLAVPGGQDWISVPPREPQRLAPGTRVRLGARMFTFESPSGVR
jgi:pSer/pThr/pTyr-binding forkhead associated (FHA) protein